MGWAWLYDSFFPHADALPKGELERHAALLQADIARIESFPSDKEILNSCADECRTLWELEQSRRQGVESRLSGILGLASIATTVFSGGIVVVATGSLTLQSTILRVFVLTGAVYVMLQIMLAVLAAVRGTERRGYRSPDLDDLVKRSDESEVFHLRRRAIEFARARSQNQWENNAKVTQMAVAHRAIKNFVTSLLFLALVCAAAGINESKEDDLVRRLRTDHELQELLRGPGGPPGSPGSAGKDCEPKVQWHTKRQLPCR